MAGNSGGQARAEREGGFSIIEIVVTIAIIAIAIVPILNAVTTGIRVSSLQRSIASVETVIQNAADRLNRAPKQCDYSVYAQAAAQYQGWAADRASVDVEFYVPGATAAAPGTWSAGCSDPERGITSLTVQRLTVTVKSPDDRVTRTIQVVKSSV